VGGWVGRLEVRLGEEGKDSIRGGLRHFRALDGAFFFPTPPSFQLMASRMHVIFHLLITHQKVFARGLSFWIDFLLWQAPTYLVCG